MVKPAENVPLGVGNGALRGVLVGAGYFAQFHAEAWARMPSAALVGVVDVDPARAHTFAQGDGVAESGADLTAMVQRLQPRQKAAATCIPWRRRSRVTARLNKIALCRQRRFGNHENVFDCGVARRWHWP